MTDMNQREEKTALPGEHDARSSPFGPSQQAARRAAVQMLHRAKCAPLYRSDGRYAHEEQHDRRRDFWHCMSFLAGESRHIELANAILSHGIGGNGHFWTSAISSILARFGDRLDGKLQKSLSARLREVLPAEIDAPFFGYNDNYPAMASLSILVGGPATGCDKYVQAGISNLRDLQRLLTRRAVPSEYASPTYSPITLSCLAEIAELSPIAEARDLARWAEERVWTELCARFHPGLAFIGGPYSRAYLVDLCAHPHNLHVILYQVLGELMRVNPLNAMFEYRRGQILHGEDEYFQFGHVAWHTMPTYHLSSGLFGLATAKQFPCTIEAVAEQGAFPRNWANAARHPVTPTLEFQASESHLHTHLTQDYAVGVSSRSSLDGYQHAPFHITYRKRPVRALEDVSTVFSRYVVNDRPIDPRTHMQDEGRTIGLADQSASMVLYWPKPAWTATPAVDDASSVPVRSLKLCIVITRMFGDPDELWLGDRSADLWNAQSAEAAPVFLKDGPLYAVFFPLNADRGRNAAIRVRESNGFGLIDLINYEGSAQTFTPEALSTCHNGFVCELGTESDWGDFKRFRVGHQNSKVVGDRYRAFTGMREVIYQRSGLELAMEISPLSEGIKYRSVNGNIAPTPRWHFHQR